jgi:hypothetical protein
MDEVDGLFERLNANADMAPIRRDVAKLIAARLQALRSNLGYWEKSHLAYAILMFRSNWLYACINELELALVPKDKRNENYARHDPQIEAATFDQLNAELEQIRRSI